VPPCGIGFGRDARSGSRGWSRSRAPGRWASCLPAAGHAALVRWARGKIAAPARPGQD